MTPGGTNQTRKGHKTKAMRTPQNAAATSRQNKPVKVRRRLYPNCFALSEVVGMLTALGYTVKVI